MRKVSTLYKQTMAQILQPLTRLRLAFTIKDPTAAGDAALSCTGQETGLSSLSTLVDKTPVEALYGSFEKNFWKADGSMQILPKEPPYQNQGLVSEELSDSTGAFETPPVLTVSFTNQHDLLGLTFTFDTFSGDYPSALAVTVWNREEETDRFVEYPTQAEYVCNHPLPNCTKMEIRFLGMNKPYRRLRLFQLVFGVTHLFETPDIQSYSHSWEIDPISSSLPKTQMKFTAENFENQYNADNPQGIWLYLDERQPIHLEWGQETDDGGVEWIEGGTYYTSGTPSTKGRYVTFTATDQLSHMTGTFYKGLYRPQGISLYDLALEVLADAGLEKMEDGSNPWVLSDQLKEVLVTAPLPVKTHRECLQIIANAGRCVLRCDEQGRVQLKYQVDPVVTLTANGEAPWSNVQKAYESLEPPAQNYLTFSPDSWLVGDENLWIAPQEPPYQYQGYVSEALSGSDGAFATPPEIHIGYSAPYSSYLMPLTFDPIGGTYPVDFDLLFQNNGKTVYQEEVRGQTGPSYVLEESVLDYTDLTLRFYRLNKPFQRLRIGQIGEGRVNDYYLNFAIAGEEPPVTKNPLLSTISMTCHTYTPKSETENLYEEEWVLNGQETRTVLYNPAVEVSASLTNGEIVQAQYFSGAALLNIQGEGMTKLTLTGKRLEDAQSVVTLQKNERGEDCPFDNPLLSTPAHARQVGEWVADYLLMRNSYEMPFREDFRVEANDVLYMQSLFEEIFPARVLKVEFSLPGQSGKIKLRRMK